MTTLSKSPRDGWKAVDHVPMDSGRVLLVTTSKSNRGGVYTSAISVVPSDPECGGFSFVLFQDFNKTINVDRSVRATRNTIEAHHAQQMANIAQVVAEANAHYAEKVAA